MRIVHLVRLDLSRRKHTDCNDIFQPVVFLVTCLEGDTNKPVYTRRTWSLGFEVHAGSIARPESGT
jgi:hypothetical protein